MDFPDDTTTTNCASLTKTKCLLNSTISTAGARFITLDIKNFIIINPMGRYEYMKISLAILPEEIIAQYNLLQLASNGWVYLEIRNAAGMFQAWHAFVDLQVYPTVRCKLEEVVLGNDFFREYC